MSIVIGLTGQSGSGKTVLGERLTARSIPSIDADRISRRVTNEDPACREALKQAFGSAVFDPDGTLNRKKLGAVAFSDPEKLELLNRTALPFITREIESVIATLSVHYPLILLDAPTLYEAGADRLCDLVVAVCAPFEARLRRIIERDGISREAALLRLSAQKDDAFYEERADIVIRNDGTLEEYLGKIDSFVEELDRRFPPEKIGGTRDE